jgi:hypothetical protein
MNHDRLSKRLVTVISYAPSQSQLQKMLQGNDALTHLMEQLVQKILDSEKTIDMLIHENHKLKNMMANICMVTSPRIEPELQYKLYYEEQNKILRPRSLSDTTSTTNRFDYVDQYSRKRSSSSSCTQSTRSEGLSTEKVLRPRSNTVISTTGNHYECNDMEDGYESYVSDEEYSPQYLPKK